MNIKVSGFIQGNKFVLKNGSDDPTWPSGLNEMVGKTFTVEKVLLDGYFAEGCDYIIKEEWMKETLEDDLTLYQTTELVKMVNQILSTFGVYDMDVSPFGTSLLISAKEFKKIFKEYETMSNESSDSRIIKARLNGVEFRAVDHDKC